MPRYIDADALIKELRERIDASHEWYYKAKDTDVKTRAGQAIVTFSEVSLTVKNIPTADVRENVKGEWVDAEVKGETIDGVTTTIHVRECSICGWGHVWGGWNYCPNCGADMRGDKE